MKTHFIFKCLVAALFVGLTSAQTIMAASPETEPTSGNGASYGPVMSRNGRFIAFASSANNLARAGTNDMSAEYPSILNVYLRDRTSNTTTLVSINTNGIGSANAHSVPVEVSDDGRYVLFESTASDLIAGDKNNANDIFLRDVPNALTYLISANLTGAPGNSNSSGCSMTPDGRYIAFTSAASDLVTNDTNNIGDVFVRDMQTGTTRLVSAGATGGYGPFSPLITPDGRYVAFGSDAKNLVAKGQGLADVYVCDLSANKTILVSTNANKLATGTSSSHQCISDDGQFVAFTCQSSTSAYVLRQNLSTGGMDKLASYVNGSFGTSKFLQSLDMTPNGRYVAAIFTNSIYVWDAQTSTKVLVSATMSNTPAQGALDRPVIDPTGRYVAFFSTTNNLTTNMVSNGYHLFVRDTQAGTTQLVGGDANGAVEADVSASSAGFSSDGHFIVFESVADGLVPGDANHNSDVFVQDLATGTVELISCADPALPSSIGLRQQTGSSFALSADARFVAFSAASPANPYRNIFVHDFVLGTNVPVSVNTTGSLISGHALEPAMSSDARYVAFSTGAADVVPNDMNNVSDVFVRDLQAGTTAVVSVNTKGQPGNGFSRTPTISADGHIVLFHSRATDLVITNVNGLAENLFARDLSLQTTYALTTDGGSSESMTPDGHFVAFIRSGYPTAIVVWDTKTAQLANTLSVPCSSLAISPDGSMIACRSTTNISVINRSTSDAWVIPVKAASSATFQFSANAPLLVFSTAQDIGASQVYLANYQTREVRLVSRCWNSAAMGDFSSSSCVISSDGRYVAYRSSATNLLPDDHNGVSDIFLFDTLTDTTTLLSASACGAFSANLGSLAPVFSADAKTLVFQTWASDISQNASGFVTVHLGPTNSAKFSISKVEFSPAPSGSPTLKWPTVPGQQYQVEYKDNLIDPAWQPLNGKATVVGSAGFATDLAPATSHRFYRIKAVTPQ